MDYKSYVDAQWREMRRAINSEYEEFGKGQKFTDDAGCLRDYAEDVSMTDALAELLGRETANERQHRRNRPSVKGFSNETAAKLILMNNVRKGADMTDIPRATAFLVLRQTAVEAEVIGWLIRNRLHASWKAAVDAVDYAEIMQG